MVLANSLCDSNNLFFDARLIWFNNGIFLVGADGFFLIALGGGGGVFALCNFGDLLLLSSFMVSSSLTLAFFFNSKSNAVSDNVSVANGELIGDKLYFGDGFDFEFDLFSSSFSVTSIDDFFLRDFYI